MFSTSVATTLVACGLIAAASLQCVLFKAAGNMLPREPLFILLVVAGLLLIPTWSLVGAIKVFGGVKFVERTRMLEMRKHFAVIGGLQALSGVLIISSVPFVAGVVQAILAELGIPITLLLVSVLPTRAARPTAVQLVSAAVVVAGALVALVPSSSSTSSSAAPAPTPAPPPTASTSLICVLVFTLGQMGDYYDRGNLIKVCRV